MKTCTTCKESLPLGAFGKNGNYADGLYPYCKACRTKKYKRKYVSDAAYKHNCNMKAIKSSYGLTEVVLQDMLLTQQGCCKICQADFGELVVGKRKRVYSIDHDHATGKVRGLLCAHCNITLGYLETTIRSGMFDAFLSYCEETL